MEVTKVVEIAHGTAVDKGWYQDGTRNIPEALALIYSEVSEALEEYRVSGDEPVLRQVCLWDGDKPIGFAIELADAVIRIADLCGHLGIDLNKAIQIKLAYNATRPYRHGRKAA